MEDNLIRLTVEEAAKAFKKSTDTIYYWIRTKKYSAEKGENGKILLVPEKDYKEMLVQDEIQQNSNENSNENKINSTEIQQGLNRKDLQYIVENLKHFADQALDEKEKRILLIESSEKNKEKEYLEAQAKLKELEFKNHSLEIQLKDLKEKFNSTETKLKELENRTIWQYPIIKRGN